MEFIDYLMGILIGAGVVLFYYSSSQKSKNTQEIKDTVEKLNDLYKELDELKEEDLSPEQVEEYWKNVKKD